MHLFETNHAKFRLKLRLKTTITLFSLIVSMGQEFWKVISEVILA